MDIQLKTQVVGLHIWLPIEEAVKFLKNPKQIQGQVEVMLNAGGVDPATGKPQDLGFAVKLGPRPGSQRADGKGKPWASKSVGSVPCPHCDGKFASQQGLKVHIARMHKQVAQAEGPIQGEEESDDEPF